MTDEQIVAVLRRADEVVTRDHHLGPGIAARAWSSAQPRRHRMQRFLAVAATVIGVAGGATALAVTRATDHTAMPPAAASDCSGNVSTAALPSWARSGFTAAGLHTPHVLSRRGEIVAVLFVDLRVRQPRGTKNKILWVPRVGSGPLHIRAQLEGSTREVARTVPDGPSYVNMPAPGCWQMTLTWPGHRDEIALRYAP